MLRIVLGVPTAAVLAGCVLLPLAGYGGVIYIPRGSVELPREASLDACAASVRLAAKSDNPAALGTLQALPSTLGSMGNVLGVCSGPDGIRHLVLANDIQPGPLILMER